jgi:hypothetical protein
MGYVYVEPGTSDYFQTALIYSAKCYHCKIRLEMNVVQYLVRHPCWHSDIGQRE